MVSAAGDVTIVDFALATHHDRDSVFNRCAKGMQPYAGPDAYQSFMGYGSDVWSLGVVFYELLSNRKPFPGTTPDQVSSLWSFSFHHLPLLSLSVLFVSQVFTLTHSISHLRS